MPEVCSQPVVGVGVVNYTYKEQVPVKGRYKGKAKGTGGRCKAEVGLLYLLLFR